MELFSHLVDPTTLCVTLLILALALLWAYVSLNNSKQDKPNLSVLYEPVAPKGTLGGKKNNKPKPKKQGDVSPRPALKPRPPQSDTLAPKKQAKPLSKPSQEGGAKIKVQETSPQEEVRVEEGNEGEWQTQLSRQQLRAMRQKQRSNGKPKQLEEKSSSSNEEQSEEPKDTKPITEGAKGSGDGASVSYSKGGRRGKSKKQPQKESIKPESKEENATSEGNQEVGVVVPPTADQRIPTPSQVPVLSDVEKALQEAAESTSSSPDHEVPAEGGEFSTVKPKKQKKTRRKTPEKDSDDWVHVDIPDSVA